MNWGMYRHMLHNKSSFGILADAHTHLGTLYNQKYEPRNQVMEVAIAIGVDPVLNFCAANPMPYGISEVNIAGGLGGSRWTW